MKRYLMTILAVVLTTLTLKAMPYEMAREEAMYLTDKMAYELNLNQRQYEYAYEINLDYLMGLNRPDDAYGLLLRYRNDDLRHILYDWQWNIFYTLDYFLRPVTWRYGRWFYPIYGYYARNYYFYTRPAVYHNYRGGHSHAHYDRGFYGDRRPRWDGGFRGADRGQVVAGRGHGGNVQGHTNPGYHIGGQPQMGGNRGEMHQGTQPQMGGNRGEMHQGGQPQMGGNRGGNMDRTQPQMGGNRGGSMDRTQPSTTNRGNMGGYQQVQMGGRGNMGGTRTTTAPTPRTTPAFSGATRGGNTGGASVGRGHR